MFPVVLAQFMQVSRHKRRKTQEKVEQNIF